MNELVFRISCDPYGSVSTGLLGTSARSPNGRGCPPRFERATPPAFSRKAFETAVRRGSASPHQTVIIASVQVSASWNQVRPSSFTG
jgi:hypothetical protein